MSKEVSIVSGQGELPAGKPGKTRRPAALFSEVEDPAERLRLVEDWYRKHLIRPKPAAGETGISPRPVGAKTNKMALDLATAPATVEALVGGGKKGRMTFAAALSRVKRDQRSAVFSRAVAAAAKQIFPGDPETKVKAGGILGGLIGLDDSRGHSLSREAIKALDGEGNPDMFAVAVTSLPVTKLCLVADEDLLGVCSPKQAAGLVNMVTGKIFGRGKAGSIRENQRTHRLPLKLLLDTIVERDTEALALDDPDFGFAEEVIKHLTGGGRATFTVCQLVKLAELSDSAKQLVSLMPETLVLEAREKLELSV